MLQRQTSKVQFRVAAAIVAAAFIAAAILAVAGLPLDALPLQVKNKDFANYWMAGRLLLDGNGAVLFGKPEGYLEAMRAVFGADYPWHNWSYPPHAALILLPLGLLGFLPGMAVFLGVTLALYVLALQALRPRWTGVSIIQLLPFVAGNLVAAQNGFLTAALLIGGLGLRDRRPIVAGILFGMLTFKPQLGLLLPVLLICERRWRSIAAAAATAIALVLMSVAVFGPQSWIGYFRYVAPYQAEVMNTLGGDFPHMMGSAFGSARSLGLDAQTAMWVHMPFAALAAGLVLFGLWRLADADARAFLTLIAGMLVVPYSAAYDFGALATFAALWPLSNKERQPRPLLRVLLILIAALPMAMLPLGQAGLPLTPVLLLAAAAALLANEGAFRFRDGTSPILPRPSKAPQG